VGGGFTEGEERQVSRFIPNTCNPEVVEMAKEIRRLRSKLKEAVLLLGGCLHYNCIATYDNGVEEFGLNEGDVHAREHYEEVGEFLTRGEVER